MIPHQPQAIHLPHPLLAHLEVLITTLTVIHHPLAALTLIFLVVVAAVGAVGLIALSNEETKSFI